MFHSRTVGMVGKRKVIWTSHGIEFKVQRRLSARVDMVFRVLWELVKIELFG